MHEPKRDDEAALDFVIWILGAVVCLIGAAVVFVPNLVIGALWFTAYTVGILFAIVIFPYLVGLTLVVVGRRVIK